MKLLPCVPPLFAILVLMTGCLKGPSATSEAPPTSRADAELEHRPDAGVVAATGGSPRIAADAGGAGRQACVDTWLKQKGLDKYGRPAGTMYAGGTPLFDERTGETRDRVSYVLEQHPDLRALCGASDAGTSR